MLIKKYLEDNLFLDFYISDGGEKPFTELLECIFNKNFNELPNNIIKLENGKIIQTEKNKLVKNINDISSPYLSGVLDEFLTLNMIPLSNQIEDVHLNVHFGMALHQKI